MDIGSLRCEFKQNPIGLGTLQPRLSWKLSSDRRGARQSAYRIVAESDGRKIWDTGKVSSSQTHLIAYAGEALVSRQRVSWQVTVWDENDRSWSSAQPASWEMGLLDQDDWAAQWIGAPWVGGARTPAPCPYLRKEFTAHAAVKQARLYISALGLFECFINGQRVGQDELAPGWTNFHKRVQYLTYDVSKLIAGGDNVLAAVLGDGWYSGHIAEMHRQNYGDRPRLLAQLEISFADGSMQLVTSDSDWHTQSGPLLESDLIMGESYDARLEIPGWNRANFKERDWQPVVVFPDPGIALTAKINPPVRVQEELKPIANPTLVGDFFSKRWIFDLGQNMVGRVRIKVKGTAGSTIRIRYTEALKPDGTLYTEALRSARATDYYTLKGSGVEVYEPHFTFHGFRYVELSGLGYQPEREDVTGVVLHSDTPVTGEFACSNALLNQLQHNINWSQKGNFVEVPTDCPQRDERLGWTGDAQVFVRSASFNRDVATFFEKWQQDLEDSQSAKGEFPAVIPQVQPFGLSNDGGPAWADAGIICPWTIYKVYADRSLVERHFDSMKRFVDYLRDSSVDLIRVHPDAVKSGIFAGFGDWLSTNAFTPPDLIGTAFFAYSSRLLAEMADVLGKTEESQHYKSLFEDVRRAFQRRYVTPEGLIAGLTQTGYVLALHFDLLPEKLRVTAAAELVRDIEARKEHLSTGFVGTPYILDVLTRYGYLDVAYRLLYQETWPSWLYPVTKGATTIWERWDGWTEEKGFQDPGMNSFNHYAYGAVGQWMYARIAGIDLDPAHVGYRSILLQPMPGGDLTWAGGALDTVNGKVSSAWKLEEGTFQWDVQVPANTKALAWLPNGAGKDITENGKLLAEAEGIAFSREQGKDLVVELASGHYHFTYAY